MMTYNPGSGGAGPNMKTAFTDGWRYGYLLQVTEEDTPNTWKMYAKSPRMYRWWFALWADVASFSAGVPAERQTVPSTTAFVPRGAQPASKAYLWATIILGHAPQPGEGFDPNAFVPFPVRAKGERRNDYLNIIDLETWENPPQMVPALAQYLATVLDGTAPLPPHLAQGTQGAQPAAYQAPQPAPVAPMPSHPGMAGWGGQRTPGQAYGSPPAPAPVAQPTLPGRGFGGF